MAGPTTAGGINLEGLFGSDRVRNVRFGFRVDFDPGGDMAGFRHLMTRFAFADRMARRAANRVVAEWARDIMQDTIEENRFKAKTVSKATRSILMARANISDSARGTGRYTGLLTKTPLLRNMELLDSIQIFQDRRGDVVVGIPDDARGKMTNTPRLADVAFINEQGQIIEVSQAMSNWFAMLRRVAERAGVIGPLLPPMMRPGQTIVVPARPIRQVVDDVFAGRRRTAARLLNQKMQRRYAEVMDSMLPELRTTP